MAVLYNSLCERKLQNIMLNLAHKLSDCDAKYFTGWIIAGLEVMLEGKAQRLETRVPLAKARR